METRIFVEEKALQEAKARNRRLRSFVIELGWTIVAMGLIIIALIWGYVTKENQYKQELLYAQQRLESAISWYEWVGNSRDIQIRNEDTPDGPTDHYYEVDLNKDIQDYVFIRCKEEGYPVELLLAMARKESTFNAEAVHLNYNGTADAGLWQINSSNYSSIAKHFGISEESVAKEIFNPYFNLECALYMLNEGQRDNPKDYHELLMSYNMGSNNARSLWKNGIHSTEYTRTVMRYAAEFGWSGEQT